MARLGGVELVAGVEVFGLKWGPVLEVVGWGGGSRAKLCGRHKAFLVSWLLMLITFLQHAQRKRTPNSIHATAFAAPLLNRMSPAASRRACRQWPARIIPHQRSTSNLPPHILQLLEARHSPSYSKSAEHASDAVHRTLGTGFKVPCNKPKYLSPMADPHWRSTAKSLRGGDLSQDRATTSAKRGIAVRAGHLETDGMPTSLRINTIISDEDFPGKMGSPRHISPQEQPAAQTSAAVPYDRLPINTSIGR